MHKRYKLPMHIHMYIYNNMCIYVYIDRPILHAMSSYFQFFKHCHAESALLLSILVVAWLTGCSIAASSSGCWVCDSPGLLFFSLSCWAPSHYCYDLWLFFLNSCTPILFPCGDRLVSTASQLIFLHDGSSTNSIHWFSCSCLCLLLFWSLTALPFLL